MREWLADVRYGARMIVKRPGTSAIAIVALALGIGLTTVMFSIVEGVILRGMPFPESDRLLRVARATTQNPGQRGSVPLHDFLDWRERQTSLEELAGAHRHDRHHRQRRGVSGASARRPRHDEHVQGARRDPGARP